MCSFVTCPIENFSRQLSCFRSLFCGKLFSQTRRLYRKLIRLRENNWERRTLFVDVSRTSRAKSQKINLAFNGICRNDGKQGASGKFFCSDLILGLRASKLSKFSRKLPRRSLLCTSQSPFPIFLCNCLLFRLLSHSIDLFLLLSHDSNCTLLQCERTERRGGEEEEESSSGKVQF